MTKKMLRYEVQEQFGNQDMWPAINENKNGVKPKYEKERDAILCAKFVESQGKTVRVMDTLISEVVYPVSM